MAGFYELLRRNRNYRYMWTGQVVSEVGDHFNNIAVFSLAMAGAGSGMVVTGVMLARAIPAVAIAPVAGVLLDRLDRKRLMIVSDLVRAAIALAFILCLGRNGTPWLYVLSALLMTASPFFTSGRSAILPVIAGKEELHAANSVTQTTQWATTAIGAFLGGASVAQFGYQAAFAFNALSFLFSAWCIWRLKSPTGSFRAERAKGKAHRLTPWHDYAEGLRYMRRSPLLLAIALVGIGWASGGGAAQVLFSLFGELVFRRGAQGIGEIWGMAGAGLVVGGIFAHWLGPRLSFEGFKRTVTIAYLLHGGSYVIFSQMENYAAALFFIALSRAAVAVSSVLTFSQLLHNVGDQYRGRVFSTLDSLVWSTMMLSLMGAGIGSQHYSPRTIGLIAGLLSSSTAVVWTFVTWGTKGEKLTEAEVDAAG